MWLPQNRIRSKLCRQKNPNQQTKATSYFTILSSPPQPWLFLTDSSESSFLPTQSSFQALCQQSNQMLDHSKQEVWCNCTGPAWPRPFSVLRMDSWPPSKLSFSWWFRFSLKQVTELWPHMCFLCLSRDQRWWLEQMVPCFKSAPRVKYANIRLFRPLCLVGEGDSSLFILKLILMEKNGNIFPAIFEVYLMFD